MPQDLLQNITLGDTVFVAVPLRSRTIDHDLYIDAIVSDIGVEDPARVMRAGATDRENAAALFTTVYRSGRAFDLLAGLLVEEGHEWNDVAAAANARRFARVTDETEKRAIIDGFLGMLLGFFLTGMQSLATSPSASGLTVTASPAAATSPEAPSATDAGPQSSAG